MNNRVGVYLFCGHQSIEIQIPYTEKMERKLHIETAIVMGVSGGTRWGTIYTLI